MGVGLLNDQVAVCLHSEALHVVSLLFGVLPCWIAVLVHDNFAVQLHPKLVDATLTPQAVSAEQPLIVTECVVSFRHIEVFGMRTEAWCVDCLCLGTQVLVL